MRSVRLLYFAAVADVIDKREERETLPDEVHTVGDLRAHLAKKYPALPAGLAHIRFARNEVFAAEDEILADADVVALIPPVAGG